MSHPRAFMSALCLIAVCGTCHAAQASAFFTLHRVGDGVWAAIAVPGSHAGGNSGFVIGTDGVLVVDSFEEPAAARALLEVIHAKTQLPVRYVIDTHYHLDHVAGNGVYRDAGAVIMAQRNVRAWERTENFKFFGDRITPQQKRMVESYVLPEVVYRDGIEIYLGQRKVVVRVLPGHTGGDSIVYVSDANVVFTGDLFWNHCLPNLIDANTKAQIASDDTFVKDYPHATFVPGHGEPGSTTDVSAFRDYLVLLRKTVTVARSKGESGTALMDDVLPQLKRAYGNWSYFDYFARHNVEQTAAELAGTKRVPVPAPWQYSSAFLEAVGEQVVEPGENQSTDESIGERIEQADDAAQWSDAEATIDMAQHAGIRLVPFEQHDPPGEEKYTEAPQQAASQRESLDVETHQKVLPLPLAAASSDML